LFTATFSTPFIQTDIAILKKSCDVTVVLRSGILALLHFLVLIPRHSQTFTWFASTYSAAVVFLAALFKKRSVVVLGGVDVAKIPELRYGIWNSWWRSILVRYTLRHADHVLAVDESLKSDAIALVPYDGGNISVLPTGYDDTVWKPGAPKEDFVLTVANCTDVTRAKIKGIDFLTGIARNLPDLQFVLIGVHDVVQRHFSFPENVTAIGFIDQAALLGFYQRAKVYLQPSLREGLPNTLCEAMLCECYPVGTTAGGIPSVIGSTGSVIQFGDIDAAKKEIQKAMRSEAQTGARIRIQQRFSLQSRERALLELIHA
jgi:glycosyltransferase involved in cell wall biosynthesis